MASKTPVNVYGLPNIWPEFAQANDHGVGKGAVVIGADVWIGSGNNYVRRQGMVRRSLQRL